MEKNIVKEIGEYGGGFFIRQRNVWSGVSEPESWKVFQEPVEVWFQGGTIQDASISPLVELLGQVHNVARIRFIGTDISESARSQLAMVCPNAVIEMATHKR